MSVGQVVIVGAGPGGLSAMLWCHRLGVPAVLIEAESRIGGQLSLIHNEVIDYLGIPAKSGEELLQKFTEHLADLSLVTDLNKRVISLDLNHRYLLLADQLRQPFDFVIVATGARDQTLGIPGEDLLISLRQVYSASRDKHLFHNQPVVVVGGGDRAVEGALLLAEAGSKVILIHRSEKFKARSEYLKRLFQTPSIQVITNATLQEIHTDQDQIQGVTIYHKQKETLEYLPAIFVFVRIGVAPNSEVFTKYLNLDSDGYIEVDESGRTSHPRFYAIGDVTNRPLYSSISLAVAQGMKVAKSIEYEMRTKRGENEL